MTFHGHLKMVHGVIDQDGLPARRRVRRRESTKPGADVNKPAALDRQQVAKNPAFSLMQERLGRALPVVAKIIVTVVDDS